MQPIITRQRTYVDRTVYDLDPETLINQADQNLEEGDVVNRDECGRLAGEASEIIKKESEQATRAVADKVLESKVYKELRTTDNLFVKIEIDNTDNGDGDMEITFRRPNKRFGPLLERMVQACAAAPVPITFPQAPPPVKTGKK